MLSLLILLAASLIVASGSIVTNGEVMISLAFTVSGLRFLVRTLRTKSRSVIIPMGFPALLMIITQPKSFLSMMLAILFEGASSSNDTHGLLMASLTNIFVLNPISDIAQTTLNSLGKLRCFQVKNKTRAI